MVVIMSHVIGNALEWFQHVGRLASLSRLLYCCTCCTAVLVHQVQQICCTSTAVQPPRLGQRLSPGGLLYLLYRAVPLYLLYVLYLLYPVHGTATLCVYAVPLLYLLYRVYQYSKYSRYSGTATA